MPLLIDPFLEPCYRYLSIYILPPVYKYICQWYLLHNSSHEILLLVMTPVDIQRALSNSTLWGSKHLHVVCSICSTLFCTRRMISMFFGVAVCIGLLHLCLFILHLHMQPWCQTCTLPHSQTSAAQRRTATDLWREERGKYKSNLLGWKSDPQEKLNPLHQSLTNFISATSTRRPPPLAPPWT